MRYCIEYRGANGATRRRWTPWRIYESTACLQTIARQMRQDRNIYHNELIFRLTRIP